MLKQFSLAAVVACAVALSACGGGGGSSSGSGSSGGGGSGGGGGGGGTTPPASASISGPLDTVQTAVGTTVISPLVQATAGTPLQGVLLCANSIVTVNTLDIADAFANGLSNPTTLVSTTPAQAQAAVSALVSHLSDLLTSLANTSGSSNACNGGAAGSTTVPTTNPLAGTPLAALGDQLLPVLLSAQQQLGSGSTPLDATQLAGILATLSSAMDTAVASLGGVTGSAPIVGGVITSVQGALSQLSALATSAASGGDPTQIAGALQGLANGVLSQLLTQVLPVGNLQDLAGAGASTDLVAQLQAAVASLTGGLGTDPTTALPANPLNGLGFAALPTLVDSLVTELTGSLGGATAGSSPLTLATTLVQSVLGNLLGLAGGGSGGSGGSGGGSSQGCTLSILGLCLL